MLVIPPPLSIPVSPCPPPPPRRRTLVPCHGTPVPPVLLWRRYSSNYSVLRDDTYLCPSYNGCVLVAISGVPKGLTFLFSCSVSLIQSAASLLSCRGPRYSAPWEDKRSGGEGEDPSARCPAEPSGGPWSQDSNAPGTIAFFLSGNVDELIK